MQNSALEKAKEWIAGKYDDETEPQLQQWINEKQHDLIQHAFNDSLAIGYDGWRAHVGPGTGLFNKFSISRITQALVSHLRKKYPNAKIKIAIAYDGREKSNLYAQEIGKVIASNDHMAYYFPVKVPAAMLSFFIREKQCKAGIMVTASDDNAKMNGVKLFDCDGAQLGAEEIVAIMKEVKQIKSPADIPTKENCCLIRFVPEEYEDKFISQASEIAQSLDPHAKSIKIVYSPLHGNGVDYIPEVLEKAGFTNVVQVPEQSDCDQLFATVQGNPSPGKRDSFQFAIKLAQKEKADIIFLTDPDCDKMGIAFRNEHAEYEIVSSREAAVLLWDYILSSYPLLGENDFVLKTITTTPVLSAIANFYNISCIETGPEFAGIVKSLREIQQQTGGKLIAAADINMAFMISESSRDKDAVIPVVVFATLANKLKKEGATFQQKLNELYLRHGYTYEINFTVDLKSKRSASSVFQQIVRNPPQYFGYMFINYINDHFNQVQTVFKGEAADPLMPGKHEVIGLHLNQGKVLLYPCSSDSRLQCSIQIVSTPVTDLYNSRIICSRKCAVIKKSLQEYLSQLV